MEASRYMFIAALTGQNTILKLICDHGEQQHESIQICELLIQSLFRVSLTTAALPVASSLICLGLLTESKVLR
jgi:hypothetical protein